MGGVAFFSISAFCLLRCPRWPQDGPQTRPRGPKMAQERPRGPQEAPRRAQGGPREGPRRPQEGSNSLPSCIQDECQSRLLRKQLPRRAQEPPRAPKRPPGGPPEAPKRPPRAPQEPPRGPQEAPKSPSWPPLGPIWLLIVALLGAPGRSWALLGASGLGALLRLPGLLDWPWSSLTPWPPKCYGGLAAERGALLYVCVFV